MNDIKVNKRDGAIESLDLEKMHKVVFFACDGIAGVSASEVEIRSHLQFYDGISSSNIQETLIKAAADLITEETPNYQWVAGRLINYHLRKMVYDQYDPWPLQQIIDKNIELGFYDPEILELYTKEEIEQADGYIKHERDENIAYVGMEQFRGKYLVQNRATGIVYETPQVAYMMIALTLFSDYPKKNVCVGYVITITQLVILTLVCPHL